MKNIRQKYLMIILKAVYVNENNVLLHVKKYDLSFVSANKIFLMYAEYQANV